MKMLSLSRGALIVFEGCDKAGKTTQCKKLVEALKQMEKPASLMAFPDRTTVVGKVVGDYLKKNIELDDRAVHLLFSANRWEVVSKMEEQLNSGITLIVDRYAFSGVAFSGAKEGMDFDWCKSSDVGLPKPDLVVYLEINEEAALGRSGYGEERYENTEFQKKVKENYLKLHDDTWKIVNAEKSVEELHKELLSLSLSTIENAGTTPLTKLWCTTL